MRKLYLSYNAPFTLTFSLSCVAVFLISAFTGGWLIREVFSFGADFSWVNPLSYLQVFLHVLGHGSAEHLVYNLSLLLLIGPILEEKYGARRLVLISAVVAVLTALPMLIIVPLFGPARLLGASGVVFAFIVLASYTRARSGTIPLSFALVCVLFLGQEIYRALYSADQIAQFAHILGGIVGGIFAIKWRSARGW